ncbi:MAG TPA: lysylphosphatidylglycerol synthase domain-containing protein [Puia sp.]|nr:lysylphosphatidylglycerol synthase domain-containing protein [Puia sp.]
MPLNKNIKIILNYLLGPLVFIFLFYSIYQQINKQQHWKESFDQIKSGLTGAEQWRIWVVVLLMLINWGLEARKWQLSLTDLQRLSFFKAYKAILAGVTIASFTPNRIGEYLGRLLYIDEGKRAQSVPLTIVCSIAQLFVTVLAGIWGIFYMLRNINMQRLPGQHALQFGLHTLLIGSIFVMLILALLYFRVGTLVRLFEKTTLARHLQPVKILKEIKIPVLLSILFLSFGRYLVFILQYYLLFSAFGVALTWNQTFGGISVMFLVMTAIPTFTFLTDLGLRWEASIQIIQVFTSDTTGIFAVSVGIWLINLLIPALLGSLLFLRIKLFSR